MKYTKKSETTAQLIVDGITFNFDSSVQNFEAFGIEATQEMIEAEQQRAAIHKVILQEFEDEKNIARFAKLLSENPNTAMMDYLSK